MKNKFLLGVCLLTFIVSNLFAQAQSYPFQNKNLSIDQRVKDLVGRMTLEEKVNEMLYNAPGVKRLGVPEYNWWNEALHGVGRSGRATIFPQAIGLAATFNDELVFEEANVISDEARAMYNVAVKKDYRMQYGGLTFWSPNINIFRDPRWGRGQETYGEDPVLTTKMGIAFVKGLQGNDQTYLKVAACAKHYAVHSGPEKTRHEFNAEASMKDLWETYLPAFKGLVENNVEAVMCAYNKTNDEVCCGNQYLLQDVLRKQWNFKGHIVSDCWAVGDFFGGHKILPGPIEASALALKRGVNLECGNAFPYLVQAVKKGLVTEQEIDNSLSILLRTKFKLGLFDPMGSTPFDKLAESSINNSEHRALARKVAQQSIVLLKNNGILPLKNDLRKYFVTGPNAASMDALMGNYYGVNDKYVTILEGLTSAIQDGSQLQYRVGTPLVGDTTKASKFSTGEAKVSDATIVVMGITGYLEGEEGESVLSKTGGDRLDYNIPANQIEYLKALKKDNSRPVIAVITGGSPMNLTEVHEIADAVLLVWYPGEEGGNAVADIIFGKVSPSGKLPISFPKSLDQLPAYENYSMKGRTYRFMNAEPMYPFGFGLSYTNFKYEELKLSKSTISNNESLTATVTVSNTGKMLGEEVIQLYVSHPNAGNDAPIMALKNFKKISLAPGERKTVQFDITPEMLNLINDAGQSVFVKGALKIMVGGSTPTERSKALGAADFLTQNVECK
jgi:beta-glucosidase